MLFIPYCISWMLIASLIHCFWLWFSNTLFLIGIPVQSILTLTLCICEFPPPFEPVSLHLNPPWTKVVLSISLSQSSFSWSSALSSFFLFGLFLSCPEAVKVGVEQQSSQCIGSHTLPHIPCNVSLSLHDP